LFIKFKIVIIFNSNTVFFPFHHYDQKDISIPYEQIDKYFNVLYGQGIKGGRTRNLLPGRGGK